MLQLLGNIVAVEYVVAENQRTRVIAYEFPAEYERLRQTLRGWLHFVLQRKTPLPPVTQKLLEQRHIVRR